MTLQEQLELYIDRNSVQQVLEALAETCNLKAEHIAHDWQDRQLASQWALIADSITHAADHAANSQTPGIATDPSQLHIES